MAGQLKEIESTPQRILLERILRKGIKEEEEGIKQWFIVLEESEFKITYRISMSWLGVLAKLDLDMDKFSERAQYDLRKTGYKKLKIMIEDNYILDILQKVIK